MRWPVQSTVADRWPRHRALGVATATSAVAGLLLLLPWPLAYADQPYLQFLPASEMIARVLASALAGPLLLAWSLSAARQRTLRSLTTGTALLVPAICLGVVAVVNARYLVLDAHGARLYPTDVAGEFQATAPPSATPAEILTFADLLARVGGPVSAVLYCTVSFVAVGVVVVRYGRRPAAAAAAVPLGVVLAAAWSVPAGFDPTSTLFTAIAGSIPCAFGIYLASAPAPVDAGDPPPSDADDSPRRGPDASSTVPYLEPDPPGPADLKRRDPRRWWASFATFCVGVVGYLTGVAASLNLLGLDDGSVGIGLGLVGALLVLGSVGLAWSRAPAEAADDPVVAPRK